MRAAEPAVAATGLQAHLAVRRPGLDLDLRLDVAAGEVVALVGPNGAGKSTALHALAGLIPLHAGRVVLGEAVLEDLPGLRVHPEHRHLGVVFQDHRLFAHLSAWENVAFARRARGEPAGQARHDAQEWLDRVGAADVARRRAARLSGGQAQRVALARALAGHPRALLLDEPFAALDAAGRDALRALVRRHVTEHGLPTVLVTHDAADADHLADRVVRLHEGRLAPA
ncbi:ABC transporter ATP-binding protein [Cellulomonas soli]|uniref:ABC transporter ATP-binding protein n=1 Tax=Cellulomonas soli TaxID=931535 RepID=UPI003F84D040